MKKQIKLLNSDWQEDGDALARTFKFENFQQSIDFINKVAEPAQRHNHHPDIQISYNEVTLTLITHEQGEITKKDLDLAKEIEDIT